MFTIIRKNIPNTITCLNLLSGALACIFAFKSGLQIGALKGYQWAFVFIGAAAVFDFLDGAMARLLKAYSDLGKELDSLSDLVSFGLAPALLLFNIVAAANPEQTLPVWAFVPLIIPIMGALRLARFNIDTRQTTSFIGLPIPGAAIFWIGLSEWFLSVGYPGNWAMTAIVVGMSLMMVSKMSIFSLKFKNFSFWENIQRYLIIAIAIVFVAVFGLSGLMWTILAYIILSMFQITVEIKK